MGNLDRKSLLILGNGADLHMGQPTKWTDYWEWRKPYVMSVLGIDNDFINDNYTKYSSEQPYYDAFYQKFKYMYELFDNQDDNAKYGNTYFMYNDVWKEYMDVVLKYYGKILQGRFISNLEAHTHLFPDEKLEQLYDFENIVIIEKILDKIYHSVSKSIATLNWSDIWFPFLKFINASSKISGVKKTTNLFYEMLKGDNCSSDSDHFFDKWWDIEYVLNVSTTILDVLRYNDDKEHGIKGLHFDENSDDLDSLYYLLSELLSRLGVQLELLKHNESDELMADQVLECYISFEKLFKRYLLENLNKFYNDNAYGYLLKELIAHDKHVFGPGENFTYDILDFNYEPLYRMLDNVPITLNKKIFGDIYQPHGNVDNELVIGGNQYKSGKIKVKAPLSKSQRNLNLFYEKQNIFESDLLRHKDIYVQKEAPYKIDLNNYTSIVIYGWSINDVDDAIFEKISEVMSGHHNSSIDITIVVSYNDNQRSRSLLSSNVDALLYNASTEHGEIRFSVLDNLPDNERI